MYCLPFLFHILHYLKRLNGLTHSHGRYCYALGRRDPTSAMFDEAGTVRINSLTHTAAASTKQRSHRKCSKVWQNQPPPQQPAQTARPPGESPTPQQPANSAATRCRKEKPKTQPPSGAAAARNQVVKTAMTIAGQLPIDPGTAGAAAAGVRIPTDSKP